MTESEIIKAAQQEADWLRYYGRREDRESDDFSDGFYDRVKSIGYTKKVIPLPMRCSCMYITSTDGHTVIGNDVKNLIPISGPRDTFNNIHTALEYVLSSDSTVREQLISIIKS